MPVRMIFLIAAAFLAAGCGDSPPSERAAPSSSAPSTTTTTSTTVPATTTTGKSPKMGVPWRFTSTGPDGTDDITVDITVQAYTNKAGRDYDPIQPGGVAVAAKVKVCVVKSSADITFTWEPWSLVFADGETVPALDSWAAATLVSPLFPNDFGKLTPVGRCRNGWIPFEIKKGTRPEALEYGPEGDQPVRWNLP